MYVGPFNRTAQFVKMIKDSKPGDAAGDLAFLGVIPLVIDIVLWPWDLFQMFKHWNENPPEDK